MTAPLRLGLVGYGLFGRHHARALDAAPDAKLVAIAAPSAASRHDAARDYPDAAVYENHRQMLAGQSLDLVSVVVPNALHEPIGADVLASGCHCLIEKPMALSVAGCDRLIALAAQHERLLAVNHELRMSSLWGGLKRLVDDGAVGSPRYLLIELSRFPYRQGSGGWRYDRQRVGSWILEEPIHFFDLARWTMASCGRPIAVTARTSSSPGAAAALGENFSAVLDFADGSHAVICQTLAGFGHHVSATLAGDRGVVEADWSAADARSPQAACHLRFGRGEDFTDVPLQKPAGELVELAEHIGTVLRCVRSGQPLACTGDDGRWAVRLCLAAEQSADTRQTVTLDE